MRLKPKHTQLNGASVKMPEEFRVRRDAVELINNIIAKQNLDPVHNVEYKPGSAVGEGYVAQTVAVNIESKKRNLELFLKCASNVKSTEKMPMDKLYANEVYFYDVVYPKYQKFLEDRNVKNCFNQVPKCYGTFGKTTVALENLKQMGYTLFDRTKTMNDDHIVLALKTFAKFHAVSFAFKDQDRENYDKLSENAFDFFSNKGADSPIAMFTRTMTNELRNKLDPLKDKDILGIIQSEDLALCVSSASRNLNQYSILTQGDCWCSNMMFLYQEDSTDIPVDIRLIDWQMLRLASPVYDISYFFYTIASEETLEKTNGYLKIYHRELSEQIKQMGSDPDMLYPFSVFEEEWKRYCKFGFAMAIFAIKGMLASKDEVVNFENMNFDDVNTLENLHPKFEKEDEYLHRIRVLANFFVKNNYS